MRAGRQHPTSSGCSSIRPSTPSASRREVAAGALELNALVEREQPGQPFVFDPVRVTDGIGLTRDPVLLFRPKAYSVSIERRAG